jgi:hypothetical protein
MISYMIFIRLTRAKSIPMQTTITQPFFNIL